MHWSAWRLNNEIWSSLLPEIFYFSSLLSFVVGSEKDSDFYDRVNWERREMDWYLLGWLFELDLINDYSSAHPNEGSVPKSQMQTCKNSIAELTNNVTPVCLLQSLQTPKSYLKEWSITESMGEHDISPKVFLCGVCKASNKKFCPYICSVSNKNTDTNRETCLNVLNAGSIKTPDTCGATWHFCAGLHRSEGQVSHLGLVPLPKGRKQGMKEEANHVWSRMSPSQWELPCRWVQKLRTVSGVHAMLAGSSVKIMVLRALKYITSGFKPAEIHLK